MNTFKFNTNKGIWTSIISLLLASPQSLALFENIRSGSTGLAIYDNHKLLVDFLIFFTLFMALSWVSIRTFYGKAEQKGAAMGIAISVSLALAIGAIAAGVSASASSSFIKYVLFFGGIILLYLLLAKLANVQTNWGRLAALLIAALLAWLLFNIGNYFFWERGAGIGTSSLFSTAGRFIDIPIRWNATDLMPFVKYIICIFLGLFAYWILVWLLGRKRNANAQPGQPQRDVPTWQKIVVGIAAIIIAILLCLAINYFSEKSPAAKAKGLGGWFKDSWTKFKNYFTKPVGSDQKVSAPAEPACISSWDCEEWSDCSEEGTQVRTCEDTKECEVETNKPAEEQSCTPPACTPNWKCEDWSACSDAGKQTRTCTDANNCEDPSTKTEEQSCTAPACTPDWRCTPWTACNKNGISDRNCEDQNRCGIEEGKPVIRQSCTACQDQCSQEGRSCKGDILQECYQAADGCFHLEQVDCSKTNTDENTFTCGTKGDQAAACVEKTSKKWYWIGLGAVLLLLGGGWFLFGRGKLRQHDPQQFLRNVRTFENLTRTAPQERTLREFESYSNYTRRLREGGRK